MPAIKAMTGPKENERFTTANGVKFSIDLFLKIAVLLPNGCLEHKSGHHFMVLAYTAKTRDAAFVVGKRSDRLHSLEHEMLGWCKVLRSDRLEGETGTLRGRT
jgi:hypothetical protein